MSDAESAPDEDEAAAVDEPAEDENVETAPRRRRKSGEEPTPFAVHTIEYERGNPRSITDPTLTGIAPATGPAAGGTVITLTGTDFNHDSVVYFGTQAVVTTYTSATQVKATAPAHAAGNVNVTVKTPGLATTAAQVYAYA